MYNLIRIILALVFSLLFIASLFSQATVIQSSSGKGSVFNSGDIGIAGNFTNSKISLSKQLAISSTLLKLGDTQFRGFEIGLKANEGVSKLIEDSKITPLLDFGFFSGFEINHYDDEKNKEGLKYIDKVFLRINTNFSQLNLADSSFNIDKKPTSNWEFEIGFNRQYTSKSIYGASLSFGTTNNKENLTKSTISTLSYNQDSTRVAETDIKSAYLFKDQFDNHIPLARIKFDAIFYPFGDQVNLAVSVFNRLEYKDKEKPWLNKTGTGLYLYKENEPSNFIGGLIFEIEDSLLLSGKETDLIERFLFSVVVGYSF